MPLPSGCIYEELTRNNKIRATLENFRILVKDVKAIVGPTLPSTSLSAPGVKIADIKQLQDDIGIYLHAKGVRVVALLVGGSKSPTTSLPWPLRRS